MSQNKQFLLIDHLDNNLMGAGLPEAEALIRDDKDMAKEWQYLLAAVDAIQESGLFNQVSAVRKQYQAKQQTDAKPAGAIVRNIYKNALRIAAIVLIVIGAAVAYKYITVSSASVYNEYYSSFELNTTRGAENADAIDQAYRNKNWSSVISLSNSSTQKTNKTYFLTAMANLELKKYNEAIGVLYENIKYVKNKKLKSAWYYLIAQLYDAAGDFKKSFENN